MIPLWNQLSDLWHLCDMPADFLYGILNSGLADNADLTLGTLHWILTVLLHVPAKSKTFYQVACQD